MPAKDFEKIKQEVKKLVADVTEVPEKDLLDDAKFTEDLDVDSMLALEVVASVEKRFKVVVPETEIPKMRCMGDIYNFLERKLEK